jgi:hypothetical protein
MLVVFELPNWSSARFFSPTVVFSPSMVHILLIDSTIRSSGTIARPRAFWVWTTSKKEAGEMETPQAELFLWFLEASIVQLYAHELRIHDVVDKFSARLICRGVGICLCNLCRMTLTRSARIWWTAEGMRRTISFLPTSCLSWTISTNHTPTCVHRQRLRDLAHNLPEEARNSRIGGDWTVCELCSPLRPCAFFGRWRRKRKLDGGGLGVWFCKCISSYILEVLRTVGSGYLRLGLVQLIGMN